MVKKEKCYYCELKVVGFFFPPLLFGSALLAPHLTFCFIVHKYSGSSSGFVFGKQQLRSGWFQQALKLPQNFMPGLSCHGPKHEGCPLDAASSLVASVSLPVSAGSSVPQRVCWAPFILAVAIKKGGKICCGFPWALFHSLQADEEGRGSSPSLFLVPRSLLLLLEPPAPPALITVPTTSAV